jgi:hypothetical protein
MEGRGPVGSLACLNRFSDSDKRRKEKSSVLVLVLYGRGGIAYSKTDGDQGERHRMVIPCLTFAGE